MAKTKTGTLTLDFYSLQARLMWANERALEESHLEMAATASTLETVAWFIEEGAVTVSYGRGEKARAEAGQWLFLRAEEGRQRFTRGTRLISLRFHLRLRGGKPLFPRARDLVVGGASVGPLLSAAQALVAEFERVGAPGALFVARARLGLVDNYRIEAAFMGWLAAYVAAMEEAGEQATALGERDARVSKALALIEDHQMRDKFSEAALAQRCGLSVNQLGRVFRADLGVSPFQYYERCRLELSRHALSDSALPIKEVAFELGFSSPPHFSNWFSERTGMSPRAWRERVRTKDAGTAVRRGGRSG